MTEVPPTWFYHKISGFGKTPNPLILTAFCERKRGTDSNLRIYFFVLLHDIVKDDYNLLKIMDKKIYF